MQLVSGDTLGKLAVEIGLPRVVLPEEFEAMRGRTNVQEDVMEAFVGAIFLTGFENMQMVYRVMETHLDVSEYIHAASL
jgi:dsRNA-specific ribonuclease